MNTMIKTTACCSTDTGVVRTNNEDICFADNEKGIYLVADGMGGAAAGEEASKLFRNTVVEHFSSLESDTNITAAEKISHCFQIANDSILRHVSENPDHSGMGCTAELLYFSGTTVTIGHVGDSRIYRIRDGELKQLTHDHTFIQEQLDQGFISEEKARTHPMKNLILRVVGAEKKLSVDVFQKEARAEDIYLLCTDGLTDMVSDMEISTIFAFDFPLEVKATLLIDLAIDKGGKDNVTVLLVEVE